IIGPPPVEAGRPRLYFSGIREAEGAAVFSGSNIEAIAMRAPAGAAAALQAGYAAGAEGAARPPAGGRAPAPSEGGEAALLAEWKLSQPGLDKRSEAVTVQARKAWRWVGEMEEIAASFEAAGLPGGFHLASAELYKRLEGFKGGEAPPALAQVSAMV